LLVHVPRPELPVYVSAGALSLQGYVSGTIRTSAFARYGDTYKLGLRYVGGTQAAPIGSPMSGTFTAIGGNTNKIVWQHKPYRVGSLAKVRTRAHQLPVCGCVRGSPNEL
jgi:hypothetical protein